jgi:hypothetical protein
VGVVNLGRSRFGRNRRREERHYERGRRRGRRRQLGGWEHNRRRGGWLGHRDHSRGRRRRRRLGLCGDGETPAAPLAKQGQVSKCIGKDITPAAVRATEPDHIGLPRNGHAC